MPRPSRSPALPWLLLMGLGLLLGHAATAAWGQVEARGAPDGWVRAPDTTGYTDPTRLGPLGLSPDSWELVSYRALSTTGPVSSLSMVVTLPPAGELTVSLGEPMELQFEPGAAPRVMPTGTPCDRVLPTVRAAPYPLEITRTAEGFSAVSDGQTLRCTVRMADGAASLTPGLQRVWIGALSVDEGPAASPLPWGRRLLGFLGGVLLVVGLGLAELRLMAWLTPAREGDAEGTGEDPTGSLRSVVWGWAPLVVCGLLAGADGSALREILRAPGLSVEGLPVWAGVLPVVLLKLLRLGGVLGTGPDSAARRGVALGLGLVGGVLVAFGGQRHDLGLGLAVLAVLAGAAALGAWLSRGLRSGAVGAALLAGLGLVAGAGLATVSGVDAAGGRFYLGLMGMSAGLLGWVGLNQARVRLYNPASLVFACLILVYAELSTRFTEVGRTWVVDTRAQGAGSIQTMIQTFEALDAASATTYPSSGFPVKAPPRRAPRRVVCLGASSTGGAYQNSDLSEFYPALLERSLGPAYEVVNQGVGGWTSFHVSRFAASYLKDLDPDLVTVYLGVNESTPSPVRYAALYQRWREGTLDAPPGWIYSVRLLNAARYVVRGLQGETFDTAVSPGELRDNLDEILAVSRAHGAKVLFMSEAVKPDFHTLDRYWSVMEDAGQAPDAAFFHTAAALDAAPGALFEDANHLTALGHQTLAGLVDQELRRLGWI